MTRISMTVDGLNTYEDLGLLMTVDSETPPEKNRYTVYVPGGNGYLEYTKAINGDVTFGSRKFEFTFTLANPGDDFCEKRTEISNMWDGSEFDFELSYDPGYTYHGVFDVKEYHRQGNLRQIKVEIDAQPYKTKGLKTLLFNVSGGVTAYIPSGRKMVRPTFELSTDTIIVFEGVRYVIPAGTHIVNDIWLKQGTNALTLINANQGKQITYGELEQFTWGELKQKRYWQWYKGIRKHAVSEIVLTAGDTPVSGVVTFTATDARGTEIVQALDLGGIVLETTAGGADTVTIRDGYAVVKKIVPFEDTAEDGTVTTMYSESSYTLDFPVMFSNEAEITALEHDSVATMTYKVGSINVEANYRNALYSDYMTEGSLAKTYAEMAGYSWAQLSMVQEETVAVTDEPQESAYIQYEWSDL